ncbi:PepSY domain-containing protein [Shewanella sp. AS1]|uniref:PepSY domain-containing protein n=1 Tax=Shewanella sp. AS1 TaxID=2907626 RepID=UPI001F3D735B|nr:PepSY domain-containing protein [Shewanella sp. AS1]MCE9679723.1 PepSY domain-containing protein [Shewanella sp. AS1]
MARWLIGVVLLSGLGMTGIACANSTLLALMSDNQGQTPQMLLAQVEKDYPGIVAEIQADEDKGALIYEVDVVDIHHKTLIALEFAAKDGELLKRKEKSLHDGDDALKAARLLDEMGLSFSLLIKQAMGNRQSHILEAQLDHDLGISYLELKLIDQSGRSKIAFDIKNQRPLPLLKWD